jgi:hypothetical protein
MKKTDIRHNVVLLGFMARRHSEYAPGAVRDMILAQGMRIRKGLYDAQKRDKAGFRDREVLEAYNGFPEIPAFIKLCKDEEARQAALPRPEPKRRMSARDKMRMRAELEFEREGETE